MGKILRLMAVFLVATSFLKGPVMAQSSNIDHGYYAIIQTEGLAWALHVNDLFMRENGDRGYATSNGNIGLGLQPGKNQISLLFSPLTGEKSPDGDFLFELRDGVMISISIERRNFGTQDSFEINPIKLRYNAAEGAFVNEDKTTAGLDRVMAQPDMSSDGNFTITDLPPQSIVFDTGERIGGYRLDFDLVLNDDDLRPFHWSRDAVVMTDTPETRRGLMQAYQRLHDQIARGDGPAIFREARPIWDTTAYMLTSSSKNAEEFVENTELGLDRFQRTQPDGSELQPLSLIGPLESASIQFMAGGRLVRFRPDPIFWGLPPNGDENGTDSFPVVFYQNASGEWHIADVNTGL
ncbi:hypothetical protein JJJ17_09535 [Paracoccus caeni]|uniref:Uncharacterized protein n=1 Tax=Paracoccus caeni TaxID=657651 RepID=A0A934VZS9_9RHOB|nr:hypothetical protein [Paracoccus caeni]MBK4216165.1 hypothetical protein [Paracoccus caeni]